ncbi:unnamed protein product [Leuciscus chuanchicus]
MEDDNDAFAGQPVEKLRTYEDFLDSQIKPLDLFYLKSQLRDPTILNNLPILLHGSFHPDQELARQLVELGQKDSSLEREEFETRKAAAEASRLASGSQQNADTMLKTSSCPLSKFTIHSVLINAAPLGLDQKRKVTQVPSILVRVSEAREHGGFTQA